METIVIIYGIITFITLIGTALIGLHGEILNEIDSFGTWLFYGLLFPIPLFKELIRFLKNIYKL